MNDSNELMNDNNGLMNDNNGLMNDSNGLMNDSNGLMNDNNGLINEGLKCQTGLNKITLFCFQLKIRNKDAVFCLLYFYHN